MAVVQSIASLIAAAAAVFSLIRHPGRRLRLLAASGLLLAAGGLLLLLKPFLSLTLIFTIHTLHNLCAVLFCAALLGYLHQVTARSQEAEPTPVKKGVDQ